MTDAFTKTPDELIAAALGRYSVLDLVEQTDGSLDAAADKAADKKLKVTESGQVDVIRWWKVESGGTVYEVRRFENFIFCSCKDFFFTKKTCKHAWVTTNAFNTARRREMDQAPYLKNTDGPTEKIGRVRI